jgi:hypothetical protein
MPDSKAADLTIELAAFLDQHRDVLFSGRGRDELLAE